MKNLLSIPTAFICLLLGASACYQAPEFPTEPEISFDDIKFYDTQAQDSLVLTVNFQDGDGDLGLSGSEVDQPYNPFFFVEDGQGGFLHLSSNDTMPPFAPPYSCVNYKLGKINGNSFIRHQTSEYNSLFPDQDPDTLYTRPNPFTDNFLVEYLVKRDGYFVPFNWITAPSSGCGESQNGRFMPLFDPEIPDKPLSGSITYSMENYGFVPYFRNDTLKLRIQIIDRALNKSNIIETPEFTLADIQAN
jgi:hypothetical protein